jgi:hypothetical protein
MAAAVVLFALAALGGLAMAGIRFSGQPRPPTWLALGHGAIAATGLAVLAYTTATQTLPSLAHYALGVFVLAALGGGTIFGLFHLRDKALPIPLVFAHGVIAVAGFVMLLIAIFS